ncbi:hypothetical protein [Streptomonospora nanhaiensis]|uniref:hypothetical protein n=1 Tax=Streptomonospora nanhaiensis TaxID=1323731 RepID=UPI001C3809C6|nr:hypothetical protein [Streptomonospora nanhaiensis]MBV2362159.1 hypothetical protein [Streptomonospora nanhaiensis]
MDTRGRLGVYGLALVVAFAGALGAGRIADPLVPDTAQADRPDGTAPPEMEPAGLRVAQAGYRLDVLSAPQEADDRDELAFRIVGPDTRPVTEFTTAHERRMHLIVVGRDMTGYQHLHPAMDDDGVWRTDLELADPGPYRVFADFVPTAHSEGLVLGADLGVPGDYAPEPLPEPAATAEVDGYEVALSGEIEPGRPRDLVFTVSRDGRPVTDLEPYLGAYGHLVALRTGDLAFLHVHPKLDSGGGSPAGPDITFSAETPSPGEYRLFLDFKHGGEVRTAEFTVAADGRWEVAPPGEGAEHGH